MNPNKLTELRVALAALLPFCACRLVQPAGQPAGAGTVWLHAGSVWPGGQQPQPHDAVDAHALILGVYALMEFLEWGAKRGDARAGQREDERMRGDFSRHF